MLHHFFADLERTLGRVALSTRHVSRQNAECASLILIPAMTLTPLINKNNNESRAHPRSRSRPHTGLHKRIVEAMCELDRRTVQNGVVVVHGHNCRHSALQECPANLQQLAQFGAACDT